MEDNIDFEIENGELISYNGTDAVVHIPDGVTKIAANAFEGCIELTAVNIPDSVTEIGEDAFVECKDLTIHAPSGSYAEQ